jgi:hypothetical protein
MWQSWIIGFLGVWIFITPFFEFSPIGNFWNLFICGVIITTAGFTMAKENNMNGRWSGYLGIWLIIAAFLPWIQAYGGSLWNDILVGVILAKLGFSSTGKGKGETVALS